MDVQIAGFFLQKNNLLQQKDYQTGRAVLVWTNEKNKVVARGSIDKDKAKSEVIVFFSSKNYRFQGEDASILQYKFRAFTSG